MTNYTVWVPMLEWRAFDVEAEDVENAKRVLAEKFDSGELNIGDYAEYIYDDDIEKYNIPWDVV